jgi:hypothetical protein
MKYYSPFRGEYSAFSDEIENVSTIFDSVDIGNAQKAYVILNAWHRRLNQKPENIKQMIQEIVDRNAKAEKCFTKKNNFAIFNYRALNYRDTIAIRLPVEIRGNNIKTTVYYGCPIEDWRDFNKNKDLEIKGIVINKFSDTSPVEYYINLKILTLSDPNVRYLYENIGINDTIRINLNDYGLLIQNHIFRRYTPRCLIGFLHLYR